MTSINLVNQSLKETLPTFQSGMQQVNKWRGYIISLIHSISLHMQQNRNVAVGVILSTHLLFLSFLNLIGHHLEKKLLDPALPSVMKRPIFKHMVINGMFTGGSMAVFSSFFSKLTNYHLNRFILAFIIVASIGIRILLSEYFKAHTPVKTKMSKNPKARELDSGRVIETQAKEEVIAKAHTPVKTKISKNPKASELDPGGVIETQSNGEVIAKVQEFLLNVRSVIVNVESLVGKIEKRISDRKLVLDKLNQKISLQLQTLSGEENEWHQESQKLQNGIFIRIKKAGEAIKSESVKIKKSLVNLEETLANLQKKTAKVAQNTQDAQLGEEESQLINDSLLIRTQMNQLKGKIDELENELDKLENELDECINRNDNTTI